MSCEFPTFGSEVCLFKLEFEENALHGLSGAHPGLQEKGGVEMANRLLRLLWLNMNLLDPPQLFMVMNGL